MKDEKDDFKDLFIDPLKELLVNDKDVVILTKPQLQMLHIVLKEFKQRLDDHEKRIICLENQLKRGLE